MFATWLNQRMQRRPVLLFLLPALTAFAACSSVARDSGAATSPAAATSAPDTSAPDTTDPAAIDPSSTLAPAASTTASTATPTTVFTCRRTPSSWDDNVRLGDCDNHGFVRTIEDRLNVLGFPCTTDDQFRSDTDTAVRAFQRSQGLTADGQVGPNTWAALTAGGIGD